VGDGERGEKGGGTKGGQEKEEEKGGEAKRVMREKKLYKRGEIKLENKEVNKGRNVRGEGWEMERTEEKKQNVEMGENFKM
jgi:hypothetical protein